MDGFWRDVRYSMRALWKRPGFTAVTAITLGLGIGASTAIYSAVDAVLFRDLPYEDADRIVVVFHEDLETGERGNGLSPSNARDIGESSELLTAVGVAEPWSLDYQVDGRAESLRAWAVSDGFLQALGTEPFLGRMFSSDEHLPGAEPVVLLGYRSWQNRFGGDRDVVGETLTLDDGPVTVIGVLPPAFKMPDQAELWAPRQPRASDDVQRTADYMMGVGRLRDGASLTQADSELSRIATSLSESYPDTNTDLGFRAVPLREYLFGDVRTPLLVLMGAVGFVLLIACANVAGLMLARGAQRQREYALRSALGASGRRLVRQVTVESLMLAGLGCVLGIGLTYGGVEAIQRLGPDHLPRIDELRVDGGVLLFALVVAGLSAIVSGIGPSVRLSRPDVSSALSDGSRGSTGGPSGLRLRNRLVVAEVAAAVVLLVGAGLLTRSFTTLLDEDLGFEPTNRLAIQAFAYGYADGEQAAFVRQVTENMEAIPGVRDVALTTTVPGATDGTLAAIDIDLDFTIVDRPVPPVGQEPVASISQVSAGIFDVLGIPIVEGRGFELSDDQQAPAVVMVNEAFSRRHFGDRSALGEEIVIGFGQKLSREIIGVVADVRPQGHESEPRPEVYFPLTQLGSGSLTFVLATDVDAATVTADAMEAIWQVNPSQSIWGAATLEELLADWLKERSFNLMLLGSFAVIALLLAGIGIYGLISFSVEQRVGEMGIRRALGGQSGTILGMVLREGATLAGTGLAIGIVLAFPLTRFIQGMLFGVEATDPVLFVLLIATVMAVATLAALLPALRAVRADPMAVLRTE